MSRELNFDLFAAEAKAPEGRPTGGGEGAILGELVQQIRELKRKMKELEASLSTTQGRLQEVSNNSQLIGERTQAAVHRLDGLFRTSAQELKASVSTLAGRLTERKAMEAKIEQLIDRHNQVIQSFDSRLGQLQKLISKQEMKLMNSNAIIEELRRR